MTREDDLEALATANGWTFSIEDTEDVGALPFRFFANGVGGAAMDLIEGEREGKDFVAFDYEWSSVTSVPGAFSNIETTPCASIV